VTSLVLDASAAIRLLLGHPGVAPSAHEALARAERVLVPHLYFAEVANALRKYVRDGGLEEAEALERLREARDLVTHPMNDAELADEALATAVRFEHPVYDALYAVLARRHTCPVLTMDGRLRTLLRSLRVEVTPAPSGAV
jgi:predicted nucleic acid-binding protein